MNIKSFITSLETPSKKTRKVAFVVLSVIVALLVFQAGVAVGYRKASFSRQLGNNFYRVFDGRATSSVMGPHGAGVPGGKPFMMFGEGVPGGHGAAGFVVSVSLPSIVVVGPDGIERIVVIGDETDIRRFRDTASSTELAVDDFVVVLGTPNNDGQIDARLIRILPPPPIPVQN